jgi:hypothetical protein
LGLLNFSGGKMKLVLAATSALLIFSFQNCSKVQFAAVQDPQSASRGLASVSPDDDGSLTTDGVDSGINQPGSTSTSGSGSSTSGSGAGTTGSTPSAADLPKVTFSAPLCMQGTQCLGEFTLDKAMPYEVSFYWRTNDSAYLNPSTNPAYIIGQAGVHYVSKGPLLMRFAPGEVKKQIYVQNINTTSIPIYIPVRMDQCVYAGVALNCTDIF